MVTGGYGRRGHTFELPPARKCEHAGSPRQCPRRPQSTLLECSRSRFHGRSSGVTRSTDVVVDGGGAELDAAAWSKGPLPKAEPLPELVRGCCGHGWPPGRACPPLGNSPSPSCQPSTSLFNTHCLTVRHWAAFRALPIISSRESISASSSPSERRRGVLAFSGPMPRHNRWRPVLNFVPSTLAAQPSTESAREAVFFLPGLPGQRIKRQGAELEAVAGRPAPPLGAKVDGKCRRPELPSR